MPREQFAERIRTLSFTNGKEDAPLTAQMYQQAFVEQFSAATTLDWVQLGWDDDDALQVYKSRLGYG